MIDKLNKLINGIPKNCNGTYKNAIEYVYYILSDMLPLQTEN